MRGIAAIERRIDRRRRGGVADAHLAEAEQVGAADERFHAEGHGGDAGALVERVGLREVASRQVEREVEDLEAEIIGRADLVDRGAAGAKFSSIWRVTVCG
jgi:hypothetical protein